VVCIATNFFCGALVGLIFYFGSGWLAKRKEMKSKQPEDDKFYDEVARELQEKAMVPGLWTKAFAETGGDDAKARALYIKYRVAQLSETSRQQLEEDRIAKHQQEKQRLDAIETDKQNARSDLHRFAYILLGIVFFMLTVFFGLLGLTQFAEPDGSLTQEIVVAVVLFSIALLFGLATRHCIKEAH